MATEVFTVHSEEMVAMRFFGGAQRGPCVQMEVTQFEFEAWKNVMVTEAHSNHHERFEDWMNRMVSEGRTVFWDNAPRQNQMAREFEENRFFDQVPGFGERAQECRNRARDCVRQEMRGK